MAKISTLGIGSYHGFLLLKKENGARKIVPENCMEDANGTRL